MGGAGRGQRGKRSTACCPPLPSCLSPKGPQSWVRAQETLLGFLAVGPAAPWGRQVPKVQSLEPEGQPSEAQSRKSWPFLLLLPKIQPGGNRRSHKLENQFPGDPERPQAVRIFSKFLLNLSLPLPLFWLVPKHKPFCLLCIQSCPQPR